jgi:hypothetical protein
VINEVRDLAPGAYFAVLADVPDVGIEGRLLGLELRDTLLVLRSGPRMSFVFLFRRPVNEGTVVEQVFKTKTGVLNVDACRVGTADKYNRAPAVSGFSGIYGYEKETGRMSDSSKLGRWPPNVLLVHGPGCVSVGTRTAKGSSKDSRDYAKQGHAGSTYAQDVWTKNSMIRSHVSHVNEDGLETVPAYECEPGCPVKILDEQSGILQGRGNVSPTKGGGGMYGHPVIDYDWGPSDSGGASRFFPQFKNENELRAWVDQLIEPLSHL